MIVRLLFVVVSSDAASLVKEYRAVYAGRLLSSTAVLGMLGLDVESCIHIVQKPSQRALSVEALPVDAAYGSLAAPTVSPWRSESVVDEDGNVTAEAGRSPYLLVPIPVSFSCGPHAAVHLFNACT